MSSREADRIASAQQTLDILHDISQLLNTQLDKETLATCVGMIESGVNPEALAAVIQELRRESEAIKAQPTTWGYMSGKSQSGYWRRRKWLVNDLESRRSDYPDAAQYLMALKFFGNKILFARFTVALEGPGVKHKNGDCPGSVASLLQVRVKLRSRIAADHETARAPHGGDERQPWRRSKASTTHPATTTMASKAAHKRLTKEYMTMQRDPPPFVWAVPEEKNILTWNYIIRGPPDSPFAGGEYHGVLLFPSEYPFKPPGIKMLTPSGRFQPDRRICFSMSDFHPGTWNPAWSVSTILTGLLSFMLSDEMTTGSVTNTDIEKRTYAARSHAWNLTQRKFKEAFPEYCTSALRDLPNMGEKERGPPSQSQMPSPVSTTTTSTPTESILPTSTTTIDPAVVSRTSSSGTLTPANAANGDAPKAAKGWSEVWRQMIWEKWRWGVVLALALLVSRMSSGS
ncbi:uncharacterized protein FIBRA_04727 [Fibroporia radiculosa]|uniref:Ubiquitin-conjugating enzyme E2 6 n=1 Tax=Fibroporia radiculosa TaxID=599839 RepID=J4H343_9APHY|nr:uncharacterized protein FIBRA_04727 [Fibroporia radiculosa]CCM02624.1 predicted protein [Fibroporia radiculosa]